MDIKELHHLMWRAGFGTDISILDKLKKKSKTKLINDLFSQADTYTPMDIASKPDPGLFKKRKKLSKKKKKDLKKINLQELKDMNIHWQRLMVYSEDQLREKMSLFWHDHFACFVPYSYMMQLHINKIRENALGSFRDMLHIIAKDAAMLTFLNNLQNRKSHPNENFAREVMELYTLGIGNYTEDDIKEAARAFTGWAYDEDGNFFLKERQHDYGMKTFMGETGPFEGEDILNKLLDNPQTAYHITYKIYEWFVNDQVDKDRVKELADYYFNNNYDTGALMKKIFSSNWFYDNKNIGSKIKSPIELLTGMRRSFAMDFKDEEVLFFIQKILGQFLGHPPNVSGWKDGKAWIDSSTLLFRMKLPDHIFNNSEFEVEVKDMAEQTSYRGKFKKMEAKITMDHLYKLTEKKSKVEAKKLLTEYFILCNNDLTNQLSTPQTDDTREFTIRFVQQLLRQPEYQLC